MFLSSLHLMIDIVTRSKVDTKRIKWLIPNILYITILSVIIHNNSVLWWPNTVWAILVMIIIMVGDWLHTDPCSGVHDHK